MKRFALINPVLLQALVLGVLLLTVPPVLAAPTVADAIKAGDDCYNRGDFMGALWHFTAAKDLDQSQAGSWEKMAWAACAAGKRDDALNFIEEARKRGMDNGRVTRVQAWIYLGKADDARAAGNTTQAKTWYQDAINLASPSSANDPEVAKRARTALDQLNGTSSSSSSSGTASSTSSTAATASSTSSTDATASSASSTDATASTSARTTTASSSASTDSSSSAADPAAPGPLTPPSKEEIESRIKSFATEKGLTTFTDANGRLQVKDASGNVVPLGPEIYAPSGTMPGKEVIEDRIQKWAAKMGLTTATDEKSGRMIAKDANGNVVPLPPSIFYPVRSEDSSSSDTAATASDTASSTATISSASGSETISSPEDTLSGND